MHEPHAGEHRQGLRGVEDARGRRGLALEDVFVEAGRALADDRLAQGPQGAVDEEALAARDHDHGRDTTRFHLLEQLLDVHGGASRRVVPTNPPGRSKTWRRGAWVAIRIDTMHSGLSGLLSQAERVARKRSAVGHHRPPPERVVRAHGRCRPACASTACTEAALLDGGGGAIEEHANVLGFALARAERIAGALHSREVNALHLLFALVRDPRSRAYVRLAQLGVRPGTLQSAVRARLNAQADGTASGASRASSAPQARPPRERLVIKGSRRAAVAEGAQLRLAVETGDAARARAEARRAGRRGGAGLGVAFRLRFPSP